MPALRGVHGRSDKGGSRLRRAVSRKKPQSPVRVITLGFSLLIAVGTLLLCMPFATRSGRSAGLMTALFTATSATCVTGLIVEDTYLFWSPAGQAVILSLIQIGGLGFMMVAAGFSLMVRRRITMRERLLLGKSLNVDDMAGIVRLAKGILLGTFVIETAGAVILSIRFARDFGLRGGIIKGVWTSVSAFCNAGFDLMGQRGRYTSMAGYLGDPAVTLTVSLLIILGGLGFYVWRDVAGCPKNGRYRLHTHLVLVTTGILLLAGTLGFLVFEWNNPQTMGGEGFLRRLMAAVFQSATVRTAGFDQMGQARLTSASQALSILLMFIGGSPGSTAGGLKTTTLAVLVLTAVAPYRGKNRADVFGRTIAQPAVIDALSILVAGMSVVITGSFLISMADGLDFGTAFFECVSGFATVGLTLGVTPTLSAFSQLVLVALMFMGRVGIMTIGVAALFRGSGEGKIKMPEGKIMIG